MIENADLEKTAGSESKGLEGIAGSKSSDLGGTADSQEISTNFDNGNVVKFEEYRKQVSFTDGEYVETCIISQNRKGVIKYRTYSWEKLN